MLFTVILLYYQRYTYFFLKATTPRHIFSVIFLSVCSFTTINGDETKQVKTLIKFDTCGDVVIPNS